MIFLIFISIFLIFFFSFLREPSLDSVESDPRSHPRTPSDDEEGYYRPRAGEILGGHYQTVAAVGKGVFSIVLKCLNLRARTEEMVALKIIRNHGTMRKAAEKEHSILRMIRENDPEDKRYCVKLIGKHLGFIMRI